MSKNVNEYHKGGMAHSCCCVDTFENDWKYIPNRSLRMNYCNDETVAESVADFAEGPDGADMFSEKRRNVIARGMKRFEIEKFPPPQPDVEILSDLVTCILCQNPSPYTLNGTNAFLVGNGPRRILIDTGEAFRGNPEFIDILEKHMKKVHCEGLDLILITHMHGDHFGGCYGLLERFGEVPVAMIPCPEWQISVYTLANFHKRKLIPYLEQGPHPFDKNGAFRVFDESSLPSWPDEDLSWDVCGRTKVELQRDYWFMKHHYYFYMKWINKKGKFKNSRVLEDGEVIQTQGATLRVLYTPGHAENHATFLLEEENALFSGDTVLGYGTTMIGELLSYMNSLKLMLSLKPKRLYCGHGPHIEDGTDLLTRYIQHRESRENLIAEAMQKAIQGISIESLVMNLYVDTPPDRTSLAQENVAKILLKLWREGKVKCFQGSVEVKLPSRVYIKRLDVSLTWKWIQSKI